MEGNLIGFLSLGALVISNLILTAYNYGRLNQSVNDLCRRVDRLEQRKDKNGHQ